MTSDASKAAGFDPTRFAQMRQDRFKKMDTNGDGKVDKAEMEAAAKQKGRSTDKVDQAFDKLDTNKDGFIDQSEYDAASQKMADHIKNFCDKRKAAGQGGSDDEAKSLLDLIQNPKTDSNQSTDPLLADFLNHLKEENSQGVYDQNGSSTSSDTSTIFSKLG